MEIQKMVDQINTLKGVIQGLEWVIIEAQKEAQKKAETPEPEVK